MYACIEKRAKTSKIVPKNNSKKETKMSKGEQCRKKRLKNVEKIAKKNLKREQIAKTLEKVTKTLENAQF